MISSLPLGWRVEVSSNIYGSNHPFFRVFSSSPTLLVPWDDGLQPGEVQVTCAPWLQHECTWMHDWPLRKNIAAFSRKRVVRLANESLDEHLVVWGSVTFEFDFALLANCWLPNQLPSKQASYKAAPRGNHQLRRTCKIKIINVYIRLIFASYVICKSFVFFGHLFGWFLEKRHGHFLRVFKQRSRILSSSVKQGAKIRPEKLCEYSTALKTQATPDRNNTWKKWKYLKSPRTNAYAPADCFDVTF